MRIAEATATQVLTVLSCRMHSGESFLESSPMGRGGGCKAS